MQESEKMTCFVGVNVSQKLMDAIKKKAAKTEILQSHLIRKALNEAFLGKSK